MNGTHWLVFNKNNLKPFFNSLTFYDCLFLENGEEIAMTVYF